MPDDHPALIAAQNSWSCVQRKAKEDAEKVKAEVEEAGGSVELK